MSTTITRYKTPGDDDLGLRFRFSPENGCLVVTSVAAASPFASSSHDTNGASSGGCLVPGMHVHSINNIETSDEFMAFKIDSFLHRIKGDVTIVAALPPPVSVTRRRNDKNKNVGLRLTENANRQVLIAHMDENSLFEDSDLVVGMRVLSINGIQMDQDPGVATTADQAERWLERAKRDITIVAQLSLSSSTSSFSTTIASPAYSQDKGHDLLENDEKPMDSNEESDESSESAEEQESNEPWRPKNNFIPLESNTGSNELSQSQGKVDDGEEKYTAAAVASNNPHCVRKNETTPELNEANDESEEEGSEIEDEEKDSNKSRGAPIITPLSSSSFRDGSIATSDASGHVESPEDGVKDTNIPLESSVGSVGSTSAVDEDDSNEKVVTATELHSTTTSDTSFHSSGDRDLNESTNLSRQQHVDVDMLSNDDIGIAVETAEQDVSDAVWEDTTTTTTDQIPNHSNLYLRAIFRMSTTSKQQMQHIDGKDIASLVEEAMAQSKWQAALLAIMELSSEPLQSRFAMACFYKMNRYLLAARTVQGTPWIPSLESLLASDGPTQLQHLQGLDDEFDSAMGTECLLETAFMLIHAMESAALVPMMAAETLDFALRCILIQYYAVKVERPDFDEFSGKYLLNEEAVRRIHFSSFGAAASSKDSDKSATTPWTSVHLRGLAKTIQTAMHIATSADLPCHEIFAVAWNGGISIMQLVQSLYHSMIKRPPEQTVPFELQIDFSHVAADGGISTFDSSPKRYGAKYLRHAGTSQTIDLSSPSSLSKLLYDQMRMQETSVVSVPLDFEVLSGPFPRLSVPIPSVQAFKEGLQQLEWCIHGHNLLLKYHVGLSTLFDQSCGIALQTILGESYRYLRLLVDAFEAAIDEGVSPEEAAILVQMSSSEKKKGVIDLVRRFFQVCHSPLILVLLEEECNRIEGAIQEEEPDEFDEAIFKARSVESTKRCVAAYATLVLGVSRLCLYLVDPSYVFYAATRPVKDNVDAYNEICASCFTILQSMTFIMRSELNLFKPLSLAQVATLFFSQSYPRGNRVFLSHCGPLKMNLVKFIEENSTRDDSSIFRRHYKHPISFVLDGATPSLAETYHCFLYRELWESTHLHVFYSGQFDESKWCHREVHAWRLMANQQAWRKATVSSDDDHCDPEKTREHEVLCGSPITDLPSLGSHRSIFEDNFATLKSVLPVENDRSTRDWLEMNEMTRSDFQRLSAKLLDYSAAHACIVGAENEQQLLFNKSCHMLHQAVLRWEKKGERTSTCLSEEEMKCFGQRWESLHTNCLPGSNDALRELSSIRHDFCPRVCGFNEAPFYILRAYHLARGTADKPGSRAIFANLDLLFSVCSNFPILTCNRDVDLFLESVGQLHSADEKIRQGIASRLRIRHDTDLGLVRVALLVFISGISSLPCILQLRTEPITERVVAGIPLEVFPCITGSSWNEVEQLLQLRGNTFGTGWETDEEDDLLTPEEKQSLHR